MAYRNQSRGPIIRFRRIPVEFFDGSFPTRIGKMRKSGITGKYLALETGIETYKSRSPVDWWRLSFRVLEGREKLVQDLWRPMINKTGCRGCRFLRRWKLFIEFFLFWILKNMYLYWEILNDTEKKNHSQFIFNVCSWVGFLSVKNHLTNF